MLARSIFIAWSLVRIGGVCCAGVGKYDAEAHGQPPIEAKGGGVAGLFQRLIDRTGASVPFTIDGEPVEAQEGDLLITAILLHRPALRRFEFGEGHRAGFCLMAACQDCWVRARRRAAPARLLDAGRAGHGGDHRGRQP